MKPNALVEEAGRVYQLFVFIDFSLASRDTPSNTPRCVLTRQKLRDFYLSAMLPPCGGEREKNRTKLHNNEQTPVYFLFILFL